MRIGGVEGKVFGFSNVWISKYSKRYPEIPMEVARKLWGNRPTGKIESRTKNGTEDYCSKREERDFSSRTLTLLEKVLLMSCFNVKDILRGSFKLGVEWGKELVRNGRRHICEVQIIIKI